jgi:hypothetical protein
MRPALAAAILALCACTGGYTTGNYSPGTGGPPVGGNGGGTDGGDGGTDGGDGGADAGDAGCTALTLSGVPAFDGCQGNVAATASGTVNTTNCTIELSLSTASTPCIGSVSGPNNAFDGGCEGALLLCSSSSLPGTLTCTIEDGGAGICSIKICDAGTTCP